MAGCTSGPRTSKAAALIVCAAALAMAAPQHSSRARTQPAAAAKSAAKVTGVQFWSLGDLTRVAIEVTGEFKYHQERLTNPERLFFDVQGARPELANKAMHVIAVGDALIKQIRVAETQAGVTRVVLDLETAVEFVASQLANPDRLMIEVRAKAAATPAPQGASVTGAARVRDTPARPPSPDLMNPQVLSKPDFSRPEPRTFVPPSQPVRSSESTAPVMLGPPMLALSSKPKLPSYSMVMRRDLPPPVELAANVPPSRSPIVDSPSAPPPILTPVAPSVPSTPSAKDIEPTPAKRNSSGDRSLTRVLGLKLGRVVLDAGHGGHDVGTSGPSGLFEKDLVLDVTLKLGALLESSVNEVVYTRSTDVFIPLEERTRIANSHKADLFLSIHANSSPIKAVSGTEVYYLNFTTSKSALDVAARENASSERSIFDLKEILQKIALKDKIDESREFATRVQSSLYGLSAKNAANAAARNRGIKKAPFVVLIGAQMPSALAEIGFLTNSTDEALLRKPEQRQKIADALFKGIVNYAETLSHAQQVAKRD
jgi:N-acetylmuramoyl-L-alanine amidase